MRGEREREKDYHTVVRSKRKLFTRTTRDAVNRDDAR